MRLFSLLMLVGTLTVSAKSWSQQTKIDLQLQESSISDILLSIENDSRFLFIYDADLINSMDKRSIDVKAKNIDEILEHLFKTTNVGYRIEGRQVFLFEKNSMKSNRLIEQVLQMKGRVTDTSKQPLPGVTVLVKGTTNGTITDFDGNYVIGNVPNGAVLVFSFVGMKTQEVTVSGESNIDIVLAEDAIGIEEVVAIGYGKQKKSDITGAVASVGKERLENVPNTTIAQTLQGAVPGVFIQTSSAGAVANERITIRGRNSITASTDPLIVLDGVPYSGSLNDLNPNDIEAIEVLKDASASAIYGSRGANGVILVTSKMGKKGKAIINYSGYYSVQSFVKLPDLMNGDEFYTFKNERDPSTLTPGSIETSVYQSGEWVDWVDLALQKGQSSEHIISVSGGDENTKYYFSGGYLGVNGLALNDNFERITTRFNLDSKIAKWLTVGTKNQLSYDDKSGLAPTWEGDQGVFKANPNSIAYDSEGKLTINPWDDVYYGNPLAPTLADNSDIGYQLITNNYAIVELPSIPGLKYTLNTGVNAKFRDVATYFGRDTKQGLTGYGLTQNSRTNNITLENILSYNIELDKHNLNLTGVYSYEYNYRSERSLKSSGYANDFLTYFGAVNAASLVPYDGIYETKLISQMLRFNYGYDSRYLLTITGRRDGYSAFGASTKWGIFPSLALGWNIQNEDFFPLKHIFNQFKLRLSTGLNGNQAVNAYSSLAYLESLAYIAGNSTMTGYVPSQLGSSNLGWESAMNINLGLDYSMFSSRVSGDINLFKTTTNDLLLKREISAVHGISSLTQNIGEIENRGIEASINSKNISNKNFQWNTSLNFSVLKNEIVSLYGLVDESGKEVDDLNNGWFIGQPITVNYDYVWEGIWQMSELEQATAYKTKPGYVKLKDSEPDGIINSKDKEYIGQRDPKFLWGMNNSVSFRGFTLSAFVHGVHGVTKKNPLAFDFADSGAQITRNVSKKEFWSENNQGAKFPMNVANSETMNGQVASSYENAGFVRIKDVTLSYDLLNSIVKNPSLAKLQVYVTGRNLLTFTKWTGLDPELDSQFSGPLQKEIVFGLNIGF